MSIRHLQAVLDRFPGKPPARKLAAVVLADFADTVTGCCYPSYRTIARKCGVSRQTAIAAVAAILRTGVLVKIEDGGFRMNADGRQAFVNNVYRFDMDALEAMPLLPDPADAKARGEARKAVAAWRDSLTQ